MPECLRQAIGKMTLEEAISIAVCADEYAHAIDELEECALKRVIDLDGPSIFDPEDSAPNRND